MTWINTVHLADMSQGCRSTTGSIKPAVMNARPNLSHSTPSSRYSDLSAQGNALAIPSPKASAEIKREKPKTNVAVPRKVLMSTEVTSSDATSRNNTTDADKNKELKDALAHEKQLQQQVQTLQKMVDGLRNELSESQILVTDLQQQIQTLLSQEQHFKNLYEQEVAAHKSTNHELAGVNAELVARKKEIDEKTKHYNQRVQELMMHLKTKEVELDRVKTEKDKEIAIRDEKLEKLKKHIADTLKGNSWERQQQLEELNKELVKAQDEVSALRSHLKMLQKSAKDSCSNCDQLSAKYNKMQAIISDREKVITDLKGLVARYEKQLADSSVSQHTLANAKTKNISTTRK